jgi:mono/diheme cytochrome c family protein
LRSKGQPSGSPFEALSWAPFASHGSNIIVSVHLRQYRDIARLLAPVAVLLATVPAATQAIAEGAAPDQREVGRALFQKTGCGQCHTLADAEANGSYAPSLDHNPHLTRELALDRLTHGQGDMPSCAGILSEAEIARLAAYVAAAAEPPEPAPAG